MSSAEITRIDLDKVTPETLFDFLELFGFRRYCHLHWLDPGRSKDPRYPVEHVSGSPEGLYPAMIVPHYHLGKILFVIDEEILKQIKEHFLRNLKR